MKKSVGTKGLVILSTEENQIAIKKAKAIMTIKEKIAGKGKVLLTNVNGQQFETIMCLGDPQCTESEKKSIRRLISYAKRKSFVRDLLLNGYSRTYKVDIGNVFRYIDGEPEGSTYQSDLQSYFTCIRRGLNTHKILGEDVVDDLIEDS